MASVSGSQLAFLANGVTDGSNINIVLTADGTGATPSTVPGVFNIEVFTSTPTVMGSGFNASAFVTGAVSVNGNTIQAGTLGATEQLLDGSFHLIDRTGRETIEIIGNPLGGSNDSVTGAFSDTIFADSVAGDNQFVDASEGPETVNGGGGSITVWGGDGDSITGGTGPMTVVGAARSAHTHMTINGGAGGLFAVDFGQKNSITGGGQQTFIDDSYGSGGNNTLTGGSGGTSFLVGAATDILKGGSGSLTTLDAVLGSQTVIGGSGFGTQIEGGANDVIVAGGGDLILISAEASSTVFGGTNTLAGAGTDVYTLGAGDSVIGQAGSLTVGGNAVSNVTIRGGTGNLTAFNLGTNYSVVGASTGTTSINDAYGSGGNDTLIGGGSATTIIAGANDSIVGRAGSMEVRIRSNTTGVETVNLSAAASGIRDVSVAGGAGASVSVTGFSTGSDKIESATSTGAQLIASSTTDGGGNVVLHFNDSSTMTLVGVTNVNAITFTS